MTNRSKNGNSCILIWITTVLILFGFSSFFTGCGTSEKVVTQTNKKSLQLDTSAVFKRDFVGFAVYDPASGKMLYEHNASKYFTPASNNKLFTFYAALNILPDSIPALRYVIKNDSLIFWGTGDPTFLHPYFKEQPTFHFLENHNKKLFFSPDNFSDKPLGPGWSWDDYNYYYSTERAPFPIYGNFARFTINKIVSYQIDRKGDKPLVQPQYFANQVIDSVSNPDEHDLIVRNRSDNQFNYYPQTDTTSFSEDVPFKYTPELMVKLLSDTLHIHVGIVHIPLESNAKTLYSIPTDSVYKRMLLVSDNFLAEQLLLSCSARISGTMNSRSAIYYIRKHYLQGIPDKPVWVDGSGLSRLDLETPRNMVWILNKIRQKMPQDKLFELLPTGGETGTLKDWYKAGTPYVHGKTGTLSNNHNLSGYLITKSGKTLIFSLMINHYVDSTTTIRKEMQQILWKVHEMY